MNSLPDDSSSEDGISWKWLTGGWAKSVLVMVFLIIGFYFEEDWRGAVEWKQAQAEIAAAGESLDAKKFIPPTVPEEKNFGALPIFLVEPDPSDPRYLSPVGMTQAFVHVSNFTYSKDEHSGPDDLPYLGDWIKGEKPDLPAIQKRLAAMYCKDFSKAQAPSKATSVEIFGLMCPALADLRAANATHPLCRFEDDYTSQPPIFRSLGNITSQIRLAKVLAYEERLALFDHQPGLALDDLKVGWKTDSGLRQDPFLVAGLVSLGVVAIQLQTVKEGLAEHAWNDQQLAELDDDLGQIDHLKDSLLSVRGDAVFTIPTVDYLKEHHLKIREMFGGIVPATMEIDDFATSSMALLLPNGWFDEYKAVEARFNLLGTVKMVDPVSRRVYPEKEERALRLIEDSKGTSYWRYYLTENLSPMLRSVKQFAYGQVQVDEARIACRLERYRLAHGSYPDSLKALVPVYGANLPHDIMNGDPYHYKLLGDGSYLLYSVGWDQIDDGGQQSAPPYQAQSAAADWVWLNRPEVKETKK